MVLQVQALKPQLDPWLFQAVKASPDKFQILGCCFVLPFYDDHFLNIDSGKWHATVTDPEAISPTCMIDMLNRFVCQLWCDSHLTTATAVLNCNYLSSFLALVSTTITPYTYLGAALPGRFCPNYANHFQVDGWPTDNPMPMAAEGLLRQFEYLPLVLWQAQQHTRVSVNFHEPPLSILLPL
jgi:hypothetical protein